MLSNTLTTLWKNEADTAAFAALLAQQCLINNAFITLHGDLGAGKTTFVRHLLSAMGVQGRIKSPTYTIVEPYQLSQAHIWHFDFYRFTDAQEWEDAGFRDLFAATGLKLAEWPEKAHGFIPSADLTIHIDTTDSDARQVLLTGLSPLGVKLIQGVSP